jgi:hypothetical protein
VQDGVNVEEFDISNSWKLAGIPLLHSEKSFFLFFGLGERESQNIT